MRCSLESIFLLFSIALSTQCSKKFGSYEPDIPHRIVATWSWDTCYVEHHPYYVISSSEQLDQLLRSSQGSFSCLTDSIRTLKLDYGVHDYIFSFGFGLKRVSVDSVSIGLDGCPLVPGAPISCLPTGSLVDSLFIYELPAKRNYRLPCG